YPLTKALVPAGEPEVIVDGMPASGGSGTHPIAFDGKGNLYVSLDGSGNTCVDPNAPKEARPLGLKPCPGLSGRGGVWRLDDNKTAADASVYDTPVLSFAPKRVAPLDLVFYNAAQFPGKYRGGAFIAMHGTNGPQIPGGHGGYNVVFVQIDRNGDVKAPEVFA